MKLHGNAWTQRDWLFVSLLIALVLRVAVSFFSGYPWHNADSSMYLRMAEGILEGRPLNDFPNGYPLLIAGCSLLFKGASVSVALIGLNIVSSLLVIVLAYNIASRLISDRGALLVAFLLAIWPNQINYVRQVLSEVPTALLLTAGIWLLLRNNSLLSGAVLYFSAGFRSTLLPAVLLIGMLLLSQKERRARGIRYFGGAAIVMSLQLLLIETGVVLPEANLGYNLLVASQSNSSEHLGFSIDGFTDYQKAHPFETYLTYATDSPQRFLGDRLSALFELWGPWPQTAGGFRGPLQRTLIGLRFLLLSAAAWTMIKKWRCIEFWYLTVPILVLTLVHTMFFATPRFTYPVEPIAMVLAAPTILSLFATATQLLLRRARPRHTKDNLASASKTHLGDRL